MKCKEFTTLIDGYMTGELSTEKQETFEEHFFECDRCYAELKLNDTLQSKEFRVALKGKMPIFIKKPLLVLTTILIFVVSSILIINRINYSKMLFDISRFEPPAYITSETRNQLTNGNFSKAMLHYKNKQYTKALGILEKIRNKSNNPQIIFFKGICYILTGNLNAAIKNFDVIISNMNPSYFDEAIYFKGIALIRLNKRKEAIKHFENLAQMFSPYASTAKSILEKLNSI